jgi:hypothetical protein
MLIHALERTATIELSNKKKGRKANEVMVIQNYFML